MEEGAHIRSKKEALHVLGCQVEGFTLQATVWQLLQALKHMLQCPVMQQPI